MLFALRRELGELRVPDKSNRLASHRICPCAWRHDARDGLWSRRWNDKSQPPSVRLDISTFRVGEAGGRVLPGRLSGTKLALFASAASPAPRYSRANAS